MNQGTRQDLTLYHYWRSSSSWRVRWGLKIKGVSWHDVPVNLLADAQKSPDYLKVNPVGFVPAVEIHGRCFGESLAILEWLEETHPTPPLLPKDPLDRMEVRQLMFQIACNTQPVQNLSVMRMHSPDKDEQHKWARHWITAGLAGYETLLEHGHPGKFSFGDHVTMADLCLVPQIYNARRFNVDVAKWPLLDAIGLRCMELPECKAAHPDKQPGAQLLA
ncbi:maleylacetoacetate isomerase [bacterium]|nr:maleylacetoacetate isomerase [bacterium]